MELAKKGCNLFITSTSEKKLKDLETKIIDKYDVKVFYEISDFKNTESIQQIADYSLSKFKSIDILINSAGVFEQKPIDKTNTKEFQDVLNINLFAPYFLSKVFSEEMKKKLWGRIVNIGSSSSYKGFKNSALYCMSKHGLSGLSKSLDEELSEYGIRTFAILPGSIDTSMGRKDKYQNHETFIEPENLARFIVDVMNHNENFKLSEIKIFRSKYE